MSEYNSWRILFMGTPEFAIPSLKALLGSEDRVVGVVTRPDKEKGRGRKITPPPVKEIALEKGIPCLQPLRVKDESFVEKIKALKIDLIVVVAFGQIISKAILQIPPKGCINVHPSLVPKYRGAAPINWAIINGEKETGVTTFFMDEGMDTGDILLSRKTFIHPHDNAKTLGERLSHMAAELLLQTISSLKKGTLSPIPQDHTQATYAPKLSKEDGLIQWNKKASEIRNQIRGMNPWPCAFTKWKGMLLKIYEAEELQAMVEEEPGTVTKIEPDGMHVATGEGYLIIKELQLEGRKRLRAEEFLRGARIRAGEKLGDD